MRGRGTAPGDASRLTIYNQALSPWMFILAAAGLLPLCPAQVPLQLTGIVNAASRVPGSLTGNVIAAGSLAYLEGTGFTNTVRVQIESGSARLEATVLRVEQGQLLVRLPQVAPGPAILRVQQRSEVSLPIRIAAFDPGIFSHNDKGWGPAKAMVIAPSGKRREISLAEPARPGDGIAILATGLGRRKAGHTVLTGGVSTPIESIRPGEADQPDEFRYRIPSTVPDGCFVPVSVRSTTSPGSPFHSSNVVVVPIDRGGKACRVPDYFPFARWFGHRAAFVVVARTEQASKTIDEGLASFLDMRGVTEPGGPLVYIPPLGQCGAYRAAIGPETSLSASFTAVLMSQLSGKGLDAGRRLSFAIGNTLRAVQPRIGAPGVYVGVIGSDPMEAGRRALPLFFRQGDVRISTEGGTDVPAFTAAASAPAAFSVTNAASLRRIQRNRDFTVGWHGQDAKQIVLILVVSTSAKAGAGGLTYCVARGDAGRLTIPASITDSLPATEGGEIILIAMPAGAPRTIPGFEHSLALGASIRTFSVEIAADSRP